MISTIKVPVVKGLFVWSEEGTNLVGTKCPVCGTYYFPKTHNCRNPNCMSQEVKEVLLSGRGKLISYTIQYYPPPPPFRMEPFTPYAIGLVELPEQIRVIGMLTGCRLEDVKIGMDLVLIVEKLYQDEKGNEVVTWKFKPVS